MTQVHRLTRRPVDIDVMKLQVLHVKVIEDPPGARRITMQLGHDPDSRILQIQPFDFKVSDQVGSKPDSRRTGRPIDEPKPIFYPFLSQIAAIDHHMRYEVGVPTPAAQSEISRRPADRYHIH